MGVIQNNCTQKEKEMRCFFPSYVQQFGHWFSRYIPTGKQSSFEVPLFRITPMSATKGRFFFRYNDNCKTGAISSSWHWGWKLHLLITTKGLKTTKKVEKKNEHHVFFRKHFLRFGAFRLGPVTSAFVGFRAKVTSFGICRTRTIGIHFPTRLGTSRQPSTPFSNIHHCKTDPVFWTFWTQQWRFGLDEVPFHEKGWFSGSSR